MCIRDSIQTDDAQKPVFIGTIFHCTYSTYSFWRLRPQTPTAALPLDTAGGLPFPRPSCSTITPPWHLILDKGLHCTRAYRAVGLTVNRQKWPYRSHHFAHTISWSQVEESVIISEVGAHVAVWRHCSITLSATWSKHGNVYVLNELIHGLRVLEFIVNNNSLLIITSKCPK